MDLSETITRLKIIARHGALMIINEKDESAADKDLPHSTEGPKFVDPTKSRELKLGLVPRMSLIKLRNENKRLQSPSNRTITHVENRHRNPILKQIRKMTTDELISLLGMNLPNSLPKELLVEHVERLFCRARNVRALPGLSQPKSSLPWLTDSDPWPTVHAVRQTFDSLRIISKYIEEMDPVESIRQEELILDMAALTIIERGPPCI